MYEKNKSKKLTIRLTEQQHQGLSAMAELYDISPSEFVRQCMAVAINSYDAARNNDVTAAEAVAMGTEKARKSGNLSDKIPNPKKPKSAKSSDKKAAKCVTKKAHA